MKTVAFASALVAAVNAWGQQSYHQPAYKPVSYVAQPAAYSQKASVAQQAATHKVGGSDWDAWGRDQDLSVDESYGNTAAKSYRAESYDEWDNKDNDKWGSQQWGQDRDMYGASSQEYDASSGPNARYGAAGANGYNGYNNGYGYGNQAYGQNAYGKQVDQGASWSGSQAAGAADNDVWAKQASGSDFDSRWGKSYDSVDAKNYNNEHYAREVMADDDQWAEDYDQYRHGDTGAYAGAASAQAGYGGYGHGYGHGAQYGAASKNYGAAAQKQSSSDWDAWGRDQDLHEKVSYDQTQAKAYSAESYDEWDNTDKDGWGAQAWGKDRDVYGASSYGAKASSQKDTGYGAGAYGNGAYGQNGSYGYGGHGHGYGGAYGANAGYGKAGQAAGASTWQGASASSGAAKSGYDNDEWAKQAGGSDFDSRWGKSYDRVSAKSYDNEDYARWLQADDDQWAEDYDRYGAGAGQGYGKAASAYGSNYGGAYAGASKAGAAGQYGQSGSDWDAYGRDQDLEVDESYTSTWAKSYDAESYDEWDNKDDDNWGAQAWGKDRDMYGASSYNKAASEYDQDLYGKAGYGAGAAGAYGNKGYGGYGAGYGAGYGYGNNAAAGYGAAGQYGAKDQSASATRGAQAGAYDNDEWAKQAYGKDTDSRWGKSYDLVDSKSYDDEQYARKVRADDDQWAEDYDQYNQGAGQAYGAAASKSAYQPQVTKTAYVPTYNSYGKGGNYGGYGGW